MDHPFSLAFTLDSAAQLHQYRREDPAAQERAEAAMTLATEQGFALPLAVGMVVRGWALTEQGHKEEGIAQLQEGLAACQAIGAKTLLPYFLALLAEAYGKVGRAKEGLTTLAEALATVNKTGERWCEAELYRLKGTLTLQSKTSLGQVSGKSQASQNKSEDTSTQHPTPSTQAEAEAEACFLKAIEIARKQQAKSLELRAVVSLARLWRQQGKKKKARQMLAEIYSWFTEGFDTKDLQEATALLGTLTG
jgi:predicted ATPase